MTLGPSQATIHKSQHLSTAKTAADRSAQRVSAAEAAWHLGGASGLPYLRVYVDMEYECVRACARARVSARMYVYCKVTSLTWNKRQLPFIKNRVQGMREMTLVI